MGVEVRADTRGLDRLIKDLSPAQVDALVRAAGFEAEGQAKRGAPIDTGFLRGSIRNQPKGGGETHVVVGAEYGVYHELGTRNMSAKPYLAPALQKAVDGLRKALEARFRKAQGGS